MKTVVQQSGLGLVLLALTTAGLAAQFSKKKDQIEGYGAALRFLDQHLKAKRATSF